MKFIINLIFFKMIKLNKKQIYFNLLAYNLLYRLKNKLIALSIPIFIFILYISINSLYSVFPRSSARLLIQLIILIV